MPPSSDLPGGQKLTSSFGSVDWLSQSSHAGPSHPSKPTDVSWRSLSAPARVSSSGEPPQAVGMEEAKSSAVSTPGTSTTGLSKEADSTRHPRVRTAFTEEQVSTLERSFQHHRYLGPQERRRLAQTMGLSEVQIKTWFQNRRMKHKRQLQDSQLNGSLSGAVYSPLALCPPLLSMRSTLRLLQPWAALPGPFALAQPPGSIWDPCQGAQASLASAWASGSSQPLVCCLPDPGSQAHAQGPASPGNTWRLCVPPETGDAL
ncbi:homeobox protein VENTX [Eptesicus fuscus]|uniref:homeobox protein VENTX n=1 Tax=Eptesicus fuscus TaxID=29078 RepID=UPI0024043930|nr:homeobox protein VENTX [Eptesicus fuscus]